VERYAGLGIEFVVPSPGSESEKQQEKQQEKPGHGEMQKPTRYTIVLKTGIPPTRPDGRRQSTISYEYTFSTHTTPTHGHTRRLTIPWSAFVPTYRGRTITPADPEYIPLDPGSTSHGKRKGGVREISLMCRSDFGKQEGEFELVVRRIEAIVAMGHEGEKGDLERQSGRRSGSRFPGTFPHLSGRRRRRPRHVTLIPRCIVRRAAVSWTALGLVVVLCVGLTYAVRQWGWKM
jgi:hypothetical protein